jgi:purine-cytosine permease-like protein
LTVINTPMGTGASEISSVLSFGTTIIGFQISWCPIAADYGVYMRETCKLALLKALCGLFNEFR